MAARQSLLSASLLSSYSFRGNSFDSTGFEVFSGNTLEKVYILLTQVMNISKDRNSDSRNNDICKCLELPIG